MREENILAVDVGNTNIVVGYFQAGDLQKVWRLSTGRTRTQDELQILFRNLLSNQELPEFAGIVLSSVVPRITAALEAALRDEFGAEVLVIRPGVRTGLQLRVREPSAVGADRIVNAVAAKEEFGVAGLVIDFGTATSFDVIDASGDYLGGAIAPGPGLSLDALVSRAAKLSALEFEWPDEIIGRDTNAAIRTGAVLGYHHLVEGLIRDLSSQVEGGFRYVVATGGLGKLFAEHSEQISSYRDDLTLVGLRLIWERNADD